MKIVDLTKTIEAGMGAHEGDPEVKVEQAHTLDKEGWRLSLLSFGSHTGTHVDAPAHMSEQGAYLDSFSLEKFIGDACIVNITDEFPIATGLVFRLGELGPELFEKIFSARPLFVVTGDKAHLTVELERQLLRSNIITFTDLVNLAELPDDRSFAFYGIPLKIKNADGSPIRAFAIVD